MAFYIDEKLFFDFYINGYQVPITLTDINSLVIVSNYYDLLPALRLDINDNKGLFAKGTLVDGSIISIALGTNQNNALDNIMEFVYSASPEELKEKSKDRYLIYATYNFPKFAHCVEPFGLKGTSDEVLKVIAEKNNLNYKGTSTSDEMVWLNGTMSYGEFSKFIASHGYINSDSCMISCVDLNRTLLYKDINNPEYIYTFTDNPVSNMELDKKITFNEFQFANNSSINNFSYGYDSRLINYDLLGNTNIYNEVNIRKENNVLNVNRNTYNETGLIRNDIMSTNIGNVHSNWYKAYHQNLKYKSLKSIEATLYTYEKTPVNILDGVNLSFIDPITLEPDTTKSSKWLVQSKTLAISRRKYVEKYVLTSSGLETDLYNTLV